MKKILFVISTLDTGGAQRALSNIVTHLPDDYHIDILLNDDVSIKYPYKGNILSLGLKPCGNKKNIFYQIKVFLKRVLRLLKLKKNGKYIACISFMDSANFANVISGNKYCKTILSVRSNLSQAASSSKVYRYIVNPIAKMLYNSADKIVSVSKGAEKDLIERFAISPQKIVTIYNGYDYDKIQESASSGDVVSFDRRCDSEFVISTMGRIEPLKGFGHILNAVMLLPQSISSSIKIEIIGDGSKKEYLETLAREKNIEDRLCITGFLSNPFGVLARSDLFIFPSLLEGFPNALVEAMCVGLPVIAADCESGVREILAPNTDINYKTKTIEMAEYGVIVPVGSLNDDEDAKLCEQSIADAIQFMINNKEKKTWYSEQSYKRAKQLSIEVVVNQWVRLIEE